MEQQTNVQLVIDPKDIVEDNDVVDTKKTVEQVETKPSETETDKVFRKVKYNGKETDVLEKDIEPLLQKGLNYDHVQGELQTLREMGLTKAEAEELKALAGDKPIKDYVKTLKEKEFNEKLNARASEIKQEDASLSDAAALRIAKLELEKPQSKSVEQIALEKGFSELHKLFPETQNFKELSEFPKEFVDMLHDGISPGVAYAKYKLDETSRQVEIDKKNLLNQVTNEGGQSTKETDVEDDVILSILKKGLSR